MNATESPVLDLWSTKHQAIFVSNDHNVNAVLIIHHTGTTVSTIILGPYADHIHILKIKSPRSAATLVLNEEV